MKRFGFKTPRLKFSLRTVLLLMLVVAVMVVGYTNTVEKLKKQQRAVEALSAIPSIGWSMDFKFRPITPTLYAKALSLMIEPDHVRSAYAFHGERCGLDDDAMQHVRDLPYLEELYLASNEITDKGFEAVDGLKHLKKVSLWKTDVSDEGLRFLADKKHLEKLDISVAPTSYQTNKFTSQSLKTFAGHLKLSKLLFSFKLNRNELSDLCRIPNLNLKGQAITLLQPDNETLASVSKFKQLDKLTISGGQFDDVSPLGTMTKLRSLRFEGELDDRNFAGLETLDQITSLCFESTKVTHKIVKQINWQLDRLEEVDLSNTLTDCRAYDELSPYVLTRTDAPFDDRSVETALAVGDRFWYHDFYVSDQGLRNLALVHINQCKIFDEAQGEHIPSLRVNKGGRISDSALSEFVRSPNHSGASISARNVSLECFKGKECESSVRLKTDLGDHGSAKALFGEDVYPGLFSLYISPGKMFLGFKNLDRQLDLNVIDFSVSVETNTVFDLSILSQFPNLRYLSIAGDCVGNWNNLRHCPRLVQFHAKGSDLELDREALEMLGQMEHLRKVAFSVTDLPPDGVAKLGESKSIQWLEFLCRRLSPEHLAHLAKIESLKWLELGRGKAIMGIGSGHLRLQDSLVSNGKLQVVGPEITKHLSKLSNLRTLTIHQIDDRSLSTIAQLNKLGHLSIYDSKLTDQASDELLRLKSLRELYAEDSGLSIEKIKELDLHFDHVPTTQYKHFKKVREQGELRR